MDITFIYILISTFAIGLFGLSGIIFVKLNSKLLDKAIYYMVSLSAGVLLGATFLHILPESLEQIDDAHIVFLPLLFGFTAFFVIEKVLHWHHCHHGIEEKHTIGWMNLIGDGIHNFVDGVLVAGAFAVDVRLGLITAFSVALHEIPQEIGDFGVLVYAGFSKSKALLFNFLTALTMVLGGIFGYFLTTQASFVTPYILPFAAGGFIYIAASDLVPELKKEQEFVKSMSLIAIFIIGIAIIYLFGMLGEPH